MRAGWPMRFWKGVTRCVQEIIKNEFSEVEEAATDGMSNGGRQEYPAHLWGG